MDFTWLGLGGHSQDQPIRTSFSPQKGFNTDINNPQFHQLSGWLVSDRWRSKMWRVGVVTRGLQLWGRLVALPNYLKRSWRWLLARALVDIPAISIPIARSLKTWDIIGIVLCDKTAHFRLAFNCTQHKEHLWSCYLISFLICHTCQVDGLSWQMRNAH